MTMLARADARDLPIRPHSVAAAITSPPYLEQRNYGPDDREIGHSSLEEYVHELAYALDGLRGPQGALRPDGALWLNLGDKANGSGGAGGDWTKGKTTRPTAGGARRFVDPDYALGSFLDVPGAVLRALLLRGWRLRAEIVWRKGREAREDLRHVKRPRGAHEKIYLLAAGPELRFFPSMLTETGSVWTFPPTSSGPAHLAPFPDELARRCILPTTLPGDLVFDPFDGSGTVRRVALEHGRRGAGTDLYAGTGALELEQAIA